MKYRQMTAKERAAALEMKYIIEQTQANLEKLGESVGAANGFHPPNFTMEQFSDALARISDAIDTEREKLGIKAAGPWQLYFGSMITSAALTGLLEITNNSLDDGQITTTDE